MEALLAVAVARSAVALVAQLQARSQGSAATRALCVRVEGAAEADSALGPAAETVPAVRALQDELQETGKWLAGRVAKDSIQFGLYQFLRAGETVAKLKTHDTKISALVSDINAAASLKALVALKTLGSGAGASLDRGTGSEVLRTALREIRANLDDGQKALALELRELQSQARAAAAASAAGTAAVASASAASASAAATAAAAAASTAEASSARLEAIEQGLASLVGAEKGAHGEAAAAAQAERIAAQLETRLSLSQSSAANGSDVVAASEVLGAQVAGGFDALKGRVYGCRRARGGCAGAARWQCPLGGRQGRRSCRGARSCRGGTGLARRGRLGLAGFVVAVGRVAAGGHGRSPCGRGC